MMAPFTVCAPDSRGTSAATSNKTITGNDRLDIGNLPSDYGIGVPVAETPSREVSPETQSLNPLEKAERAALLREIDLHHGNISRVASKLSIGRNTLYRKMRRLGIAFPARQSARR